MRTMTIIPVIVLSLLGYSCSYEVDTTPPKPPQGIRTVTRDNAVEIYWLPCQDDDVKGYNVWVSDAYNGRYQLIGSTSETNFVDYDAVNGYTYYYAVSSFDFHGNESELSKDVVYDTPRPEGYNVVIFDYVLVPNSSGYNFGLYSVVNYADADFFFSVDEYGKRCLLVWDDTDIQDMGYTRTLFDITSAPEDGWSPSGSAEVILGHTYVIWTFDNHYAKVRIKEIGSNYIKFDWAYQIAEGNPELRVSRKDRSISRFEAIH